MSTVVVLYGQRRAIIKTTPGKPLSEVRAEACTKFGLSTPSSYVLKRGGSRIDLSLPIRLTNLGPGAKLELVRTSSSSAPISVVLRSVDLAEQLSDTFVPTTSIWEILRKFEKKVSTKGQTDFNITERCSPTVSNPGSGRLLYQMPAVRVANRELASFDELRKTLEDLGCHGRELLVLRYLPTEMPFEDALMQIASFSGEGAGEEEQPEEEEKTAEVTAEEVERVGSSEPQTSHPPATGPQTTTEIPQDTQIARASKTTLVKPIKKTIMPLQPETQGDGDLDLVEPKIEIYQPSSSAKPAAASFEVPDSAYDITIADLKRIKESYHTAGMPQRLLSDSELEEKQAMARKEMEKINTLKIKVRFPDGYLSQQELHGKVTAQDLYKLIRSTLRHQNEPFVLLFPPNDVIKDDTKRLTVDLKLRSGASLHLRWSQYASNNAKNEPCLTDELLKISKELPKPSPPNDADFNRNEDEHDDAPKDKSKDGKSSDSKTNVEKRLKGLLRLSKK